MLVACALRPCWSGVARESSHIRFAERTFPEKLGPLGGWYRSRGKIAGRKIDGSIRSRGKKRDHTIYFCQFQRAFQHAASPRQPQFTAGFFQAGETANNAANGRAVNVGKSRHIEDDMDLAGLDKGVHFMLDPTAVRTAMDAALHFDDGDAGFELALCHLQNHAYAPG